MDAKRTSGVVWSILLLVCGGCAAVEGPSPTARPKEDSTTQVPEPPQVVQSPTPADSDETTDDLTNSISRFIESVETAAQRRALRERLCRLPRRRRTRIRVWRRNRLRPYLRRPRP